MVDRNEGCLKCEHFAEGGRCQLRRWFYNYLDGSKNARFETCNTQNKDCLCPDFEKKKEIEGCIDACCAGKGVVVDCGNDRYYRVWCSACGALGPERLTEAGATQAWNKLRRD